ncbi:MAG TPA: hypothetical protein VGR11_08625 [Solirubrobacteraceae bacterium]|nr:hypothetical protein [Solirubrobacteraceae bacterium]
MTGSDPMFIPPVLHELESEVKEEVWGQARAEAEVGALVEQYGDAALVHFARRMASLDPQRRQQLNELARSG